MRQILARRLNSVMAAGAIAGDPDVVEVGWKPTGRRMAIITIITGRYVRQMFAGRRCTVVARATGANNLRVVHGVGRCEQGGVVTVFAHIAALYMRWPFADRINAIVATGAVIDDTQMIEVRRPPCDR